MTVRLINHEVIPRCGSFEVRYSDGRPSRYFYWDDKPSCRLRPELLTGKEAEKQAKALARAERGGYLRVAISTPSAYLFCMFKFEFSLPTKGKIVPRASVVSRNKI